LRHFLKQSKNDPVNLARDLYGAIMEWTDKKGKKLSTKNQVAPPPNSRVRWRDPKTGQFIKSPVELPQTKRVLSENVVKYRSEGGRWKTFENTDFGRQKVQVALFERSGKKLRTLDTEYRRRKKSETALYQLEELPPVPEGRKTIYKLEGSTVKDAIDHLHFTGLGWGAIVQWGIQIISHWKDASGKWHQNSLRTVEDIEDWRKIPGDGTTGLPKGETFESILKNRMAEKIRSRMFSNEFRFTEMAAMTERLHDPIYWQGNFPGEMRVKEILNDWRGNTQIERCEIIISFNLLETAQSQYIPESHITKGRKKVGNSIKTRRNS
jgi:hypothetical protein